MTDALVQQTIVPLPEIPEALLGLPVTKQIGTIDFTKKAFLVRAQTASGKTMVLPATEALRRKRSGISGCVAVRIPTKAAGQWVVSGLTKLWEPLGIKVAVLNRDVREDTDAFRAVKNADLVVISDGSLNRLRKMREVGVYYCDEAHDLSLAAELDLACAKLAGMKLRLLSATVDPILFKKYLGPECGDYVLEGRIFPIRKHVIWASEDVFDRTDGNELYSILDRAIADLKATGESGMVFTPTRQMAEDGAAHFAKSIPTTFVHGGVSPLDAETWVNEHSGQPMLIFATTALIAGVTLDIHRVWICDEVIDSHTRDGIEHQSAEVMDDNRCLQGAGRAGRLREGDAYLITHPGKRQRDDVWAGIRPRPIVPPSEKETPDDVLLALAAQGITKDKDIDILGNLDPSELRASRAWLQSYGCLDAEGALTQLGQLVNMFPMTARYAHLVVSAPSIRSRLVILAALTLGLSGTYGLLRIKPRSKQLTAKRMAEPGWQLIDKSMVIQDSVPLTLARIMQEVVRRDSSAIYDWAGENNFWPKPLFVARKDFLLNAEMLAKGVARQGFVVSKLEDPKLAQEIHDHLKRHSLFRRDEICDGKLTRGAGFLDSVFTDCFGIEGTGLEHDCWSIAKTQKGKTGFRFWSLNFAILEPLPADDEATIENDQRGAT